MASTSAPIPLLDERDRFFGWVLEKTGISGSLATLYWKYLVEWLHGGSSPLKTKAEAEAWVVENQAAILRKSREDIKSHWAPTGKEQDFAIHRAVARAGLANNNLDINTDVSRMVAQIALAMKGRYSPIWICDFGAGTGKTSEALLDRLALVLGDEAGSEFVSRHIALELIDPSLERLTEAKENLEKHRLVPACTIYTGGASLEEALPRMAPGSYHIGMASAVFHHMSTPDHLALIHPKLVPDGALVIGDWYHSLFGHPARFMPVLNAMGVNKRKIREFGQVFGVGPRDLERVNRGLTASQLQDNEVAIRYLAALGGEIVRIGGQGCPVLEAVHSFDQAVVDMRGAGFEYDMKEFKSKHRSFFKTLPKGFQSMSRVQKPHNINGRTVPTDLSNVVALGKRARR